MDRQPKTYVKDIDITDTNFVGTIKSVADGRIATSPYAQTYFMPGNGHTAYTTENSCIGFSLGDGNIEDGTPVVGV